MSADYGDAASMRRPQGAVLVDGVQVADTAQCVHCNAHFVMRKGSGTIRGWCRNCGGVVCGKKCAKCVPFEKKIELMERFGR